MSANDDKRELLEMWEDLVAANKRAPGHEGRKKRLTEMHAKLTAMGEEVELPEFTEKKALSATSAKIIGTSQWQSAGWAQVLADKRIRERLGVDSGATDSTEADAAEQRGKMPEKVPDNVRDIKEIEAHNKKRSETKEAEDENSKSLLTAAKKGEAAEVRLLLDKGACINDTDRLGNTALHLAAMKGYPEVAQILCENEALLTSTGKLKLTPLGVAIKFGHAEVAEIILAHGSPVDMQSMKMVVEMHGQVDTKKWSSVLQTILHRVETLDEATTSADFMIGISAAEMLPMAMKAQADLNK